MDELNRFYGNFAATMKNAALTASTRPYLIRALFEWCTDNALTPYVAVKVDASVQVPKEYVQNGEIVLNISTEATSGLHIGNDFVEFKARFGGTPRQIIVPVGQIIAVYAKENGQGMAFPHPPAHDGVSPDPKTSSQATPLHKVQTPRGDAPALRPALAKGADHVLQLMSAKEPPLPATKGAEHATSSDDQEKGLQGTENSTQEQADPPGPKPPTSGASARPKLTRIK